MSSAGVLWKLKLAFMFKKIWPLEAEEGVA
jgi:hypothetical protein